MYTCVFKSTKECDGCEKCMELESKHYKELEENFLINAYVDEMKELGCIK